MDNYTASEHMHVHSNNIFWDLNPVYTNIFQSEFHVLRDVRIPLYNAISKWVDINVRSRAVNIPVGPKRSIHTPKIIRKVWNT
jgi:hypothetical protein